MSVTEAALPDPVRRFRERFRAERMPRRYSGRLHFAFVTSLSLGTIVWALARVHAPTGAELAVVPAAFLYANLVEYFAHRGPMHRRMRPLELLFERHALQHHFFFTHEAMAARDSRDWVAVLFPPYLIVFIVSFAVPVWWLLDRCATPNLAGLFLATAIGYFINYEWAHLAYHQAEGSWVSRIPGMSVLRRHHTLHHDPRLMAKRNFNITWPIFDRVFGTHTLREK